MDIILGPSSPALGKRISRALNSKIIGAEFKKFPDGELYARLSSESECAAIIQSICSNDDLILLILLLDALEEAEKVVVIPYFGYARQDRKFKEGEGISIRAIAGLIENYTDKIITVNLHSEMAKSYFKNIYEIDAMPLIGRMYKNKDVVMISPDLGSVERVKIAAEYADCDFDYLEKKRIDASHVEITPKEIDVEGKEIVIVDDIISTGGTIIEATKVLKDLGAKRVEAVCVHAVLANYALSKLFNSGIDDVIATDTIERIISRITVADEIAEVLQDLKP
ncbi:ribose-phosphate diphosphokinase [Archaeoglobales archaeon]|nr:MAG: ribose-phosphate diphosphokinase [Archaeoglobales archaeon]